MINQTYVELLEDKDIIFELFAYANKRRAEVGAENVYDFSLGNPSVAPPAKLHDALRELLDECDPVSMHGYSPQGGLPGLRKVIAEDINKRFGTDFSPDSFFMTCSAASALAHAFRAVTKPGDKILAFAPCFSEYKVYVQGVGCEFGVVPPDTETFEINFEAAERMMDEKVAAVIVNSPNNPSGVVYRPETVKKLAELLEAKSAEYGRPIYIISDEPYREIVFSGTEAPFISNNYDNSIICYSYSKSLSLPGERIGYIAVNPKAQDAEMLVKICTQISRHLGENGAPMIWQRVLEKVLPCTADLSVYEKNAKIFYDALTSYGYECAKPGGAFYMMPKMPGGNSDEFMKKALENDIIVVPGDGFGCPGYFRIAYCVPTERVERSLENFKKLI